MKRVGVLLRDSTGKTYVRPRVMPRVRVRVRAKGRGHTASVPVERVGYVYDPGRW